jgi:osmoprotectant transport system permease protein
MVHGNPSSSFLFRGLVAALRDRFRCLAPDHVGMGLSDQQLLWRVQAPLALPAVLAGLRIATVSTVGMVTVGALVGYGGYGTMILAGLNENFYHAKIATATICAVALAVALDGLLLLVERHSTPWARGR